MIYYYVDALYFMCMCYYLIYVLLLYIILHALKSLLVCMLRSDVNVGLKTVKLKRNGFPWVFRNNDFGGHCDSLLPKQRKSYLEHYVKVLASAMKLD